MYDIIKLENITKSFTTNGKEAHILKNISFSISKGEYVAIIGSSGSGKSTLMNIMGCLDMQTKGDFYLKGKNVKSMTEKEKTYFRGKELGFIFQKFYLLEYLTALDNIKLPMLYQDKWQEDKTNRANYLLHQVGLLEKAYLTPKQLSGGQQQRVAIARALACYPDIILADEPTGNLDKKSAIIIMDILKKLNEKGQTLVIITHDANIAASANRVIQIENGVLISDKKNSIS